MKFYVSKCRNTLNGRQYSPEIISNYLCVNPYYSIKITPYSRVKIIIDSGAFQDVGNDSRLSFKDALKRQLNFEKNKIKRRAEAIVSYDRLVDEQLDLTKGQVKKRVDYNIGKEYVDETILAAKFLSSKRDSLGKRKLVLSCQGVSSNQYLSCMDEILSLSHKNDIIGLGGFCIISKSLEYENQYYEIITRGFKKIKEAGLKRVHLFGVGKLRPLLQSEIYAKQLGLDLSYDTSSPEINGTFGKVFNPETQMLNQMFMKEQKKNGYHPVDLAVLNLKNIIHFWNNYAEIDPPSNFTPKYISKTNKKNNRYKNELTDTLQNITISSSV